MVESFLVVGLNPVIQRTLLLERLRPGEVNRASQYWIDASGKGVNVARVLGQLGERAVHLTQIGGHQEALFLSLAGEDGVVLAPVPTQSEIRFCCTLLDAARHTTTEIVEEAEPISPGTEERVRRRFSELLPAHSQVVVSGTRATGFSSELVPDLVREARKRKAAVVLDLRSEDLIHSLPERPTLIKPNYAEFVGTFLSNQMPSEHERDGEMESAVRERMLEINREFGCHVVLTRGAFPTLFTHEGQVCETAVEPLRPLNTTGCGDAMTAGLASALARGSTLPQAILRGHDCARTSARCVRPGTLRRGSSEPDCAPDA